MRKSAFVLLEIKLTGITTKQQLPASALKRKLECSIVRMSPKSPRLRMRFLKIVSDTVVLTTIYEPINRQAGSITVI
jgi:hypothetical protein